jgi:hypothetical protein
MFDTYPEYWPYRALKRREPMIGLPDGAEDVFALQIALNAALNAALYPDGILGDRTAKAIMSFQESRSDLADDGVAGQLTQRALAMHIVKELAATFSVKLPDGLAFGQLSHESSFLLGNYSAKRANGSYDAGVTQRNTEHTHPGHAFNPRESVSELLRRVTEHYVLFAGVTPARRRWELAAGSWNAPAFACLLAYREGATGVPASRRASQISDAARATFEAYMDSVTAYMQL